MEQIQDFIANIVAIKELDIVIAIAIIVLFRIFSASLSYIIIKMFKFKTKNQKKIKESAFYKPLITFIRLLGIYIAVVFLKEPFNISEDIMEFAKKLFIIFSTILCSKGFALSFTPDSSIVKKVKTSFGKEVEDSILIFILKLIRGIIYVSAGFIVLNVLGINLNGLVAGLGIGGVIITLAAQDTAKNLFGGLVIFLDRPFVVGDWIEVDTFEGTVEDITFRSTRVRTFENSLVNIPNSVIANASIINWSKMEKRRYKTNLCLELDTPLDKLEIFKQRVHEMLRSNDTVADESIIVRFDSIVDNGINVLISSYTESVDYVSYLEEREKINYKIMRILKEENIELAYDTKTIYTKTAN